MASDTRKPRISCLMITKDRLTMIFRSIKYFLRQTWSDKELIIVSDGPEGVRSELRQHVRDLGTGTVHFYEEVPSTVGRLRNVTVGHATGDVLCQWDDDDYYHPRRLEEQWLHLEASGADATYLYDQLHFFADTSELFWTDWSARRSEHADMGAPGSLMCRKNADIRYHETGEKAQLGEDAFLQIELYRRCKVSGLVGMGHLYAYVYNGTNSWARPHHRRIVEQMSFPEEFLKLRLGDLSHALPAYFPSPPAEITGRAGGRIRIPYANAEDRS